MSDTPKTDAATETIVHRYQGCPYGHTDYVSVEFARKLERESAALRHDIARAQETGAQLATENVALREQLKTAQEEASDYKTNCGIHYEERVAAEQRLAAEKQSVNELNNILRAAGWGQGEIDSCAETIYKAEQRAAQIEQETIERCAKVCDELGNSDGYVTRGYWACGKEIRTLTSAAEPAAVQESVPQQPRKGLSPAPYAAPTCVFRTGCSHPDQCFEKGYCDAQENVNGPPAPSADPTDGSDERS